VSSGRLDLFPPHFREVLQPAPVVFREGLITALPGNVLDGDAAKEINFILCLQPTVRLQMRGSKDFDCA